MHQEVQTNTTRGERVALFFLSLTPLHVCWLLWPCQSLVANGAFRCDLPTTPDSKLHLALREKMISHRMSEDGLTRVSKSVQRLHSTHHPQNCYQPCIHPPMVAGRCSLLLIAAFISNQCGCGDNGFLSCDRPPLTNESMQATQQANIPQTYRLSNYDGRLPFPNRRLSLIASRSSFANVHLR